MNKKKPNYIRILGCGSSQGVPKIDGSWGHCKKNARNYRSRSSIFVSLNGLDFLIDTSPDIKDQFLKNKINNINFVLFTHAHADHILGIKELRTYFVKNKKNYPAVLKSNIIKKKFKIKKKININTINVVHGEMPTIGYRINNFAYIPDFKIINEKEIKKLKNLEVLIIDCFRFKKHKTHVNFDESIKYIKNINPKKA